MFELTNALERLKIEQPCPTILAGANEATPPAIESNFVNPIGLFGCLTHYLGVQWVENFDAAVESCGQKKLPGGMKRNTTDDRGKCIGGCDQSACGEFPNPNFKLILAASKTLDESDKDKTSPSTKLTRSQ